MSHNVCVLTRKPVVQVLQDFLAENTSLPPHIHNPAQLPLDIHWSTLVCHGCGIGNKWREGIQEVVLVPRLGLLRYFYSNVSSVSTGRFAVRD